MLDFMIDLPLDHIAIAVPSLDEAATLHEQISGAVRSPTEVLESQGVRVTFVGQVELLEPLGPDTPVGRFLERRGAGLHHLAYRSRDLEADLRRLRKGGFVLVDQEPRPGARGHRVAFLHPGSTGRALVELVEHRGT